MQYSNIAARVVRRALKTDLQTDAAKREVTSLKFKKWINGKPEGKNDTLKSLLVQIIDFSLLTFRAKRLNVSRTGGARYNFAPLIRLNRAAELF